MTTLNTTTADRAIIADQVFARRDAGMTERQIAADTGLSRGQVRRIVAAYSRVHRDGAVAASIFPMTATR